MNVQNKTDHKAILRLALRDAETADLVLVPPAALRAVLAELATARRDALMEAVWIAGSIRVKGVPIRPEADTEADKAWRQAADEIDGRLRVLAQEGDTRGKQF